MSLQNTGWFSRPLVPADSMGLLDEWVKEDEEPKAKLAAAKIVTEILFQKWAATEPCATVPAGTSCSHTGGSSPLQLQIVQVLIGHGQKNPASARIWCS